MSGMHLAASDIIRRVTGTHHGALSLFCQEPAYLGKVSATARSGGLIQIALPSGALPP